MIAVCFAHFSFYAVSIHGAAKGFAAHAECRPHGKRLLAVGFHPHHFYGKCQKRVSRVEQLRNLFGAFQAFFFFKRLSDFIFHMRKKAGRTSLSYYESGQFICRFCCSHFLYTVRVPWSSKALRGWALQCRAPGRLREPPAPYLRRMWLYVCCFA